ncbi:hypothetical protein BDK51DRAFT_45521 [Blyttiomyces helicus]|uniref:Uncharacterized protein n=1 Tax=Blyttiomyces helicus TaxID=388810 RepID=A0A4P9WI91_9FUNG|nr:hypothetical protein BDK51DRAFT_45521 [Blyttiomyces helicus]|eukprot:RKO91593.1 hypothetical protein BDK51DRAFT_45521 [Blyttiomyces helicus]
MVQNVGGLADDEEGERESGQGGAAKGNQLRLRPRSINQSSIPLQVTFLRFRPARYPFASQSVIKGYSRNPSMFDIKAARLAQSVERETLTPVTSQGCGFDPRVGLLKSAPLICFFSMNPICPPATPVIKGLSSTAAALALASSVPEDFGRLEMREGRKCEAAEESGWILAVPIVPSGGAVTRVAPTKLENQTLERSSQPARIFFFQHQFTLPISKMLLKSLAVPLAFTLQIFAILAAPSGFPDCQHCVSDEPPTLAIPSLFGTPNVFHADIFPPPTLPSPVPHEQVPNPYWGADNRPYGFQNGRSCVAVLWDDCQPEPVAAGGVGAETPSASQNASTASIVPSTSPTPSPSPSLTPPSQRSASRDAIDAAIE